MGSDLQQLQVSQDMLHQPHILPAGPELQQLLASKDALVSQGAKQAMAAATVAASAELAAMRSTLQVLSSHLEALQADPAALGTKGRAPILSHPFHMVCILRVLYMMPFGETVREDCKLAACL